MLHSLCALDTCVFGSWWPQHRDLVTLAIETSCDDTSVCILESRLCRATGRTAAKLHFHEKVTANNTAFKGVHPLVSLESHQENLGHLIARSLKHLPANHVTGADANADIVHGSAINGASMQFESTVIGKKLPDFISVTRGPGMRSNLSTGLDTAKGLSVAWQIPLVGVHHMQAHALTPRLVTALQAWSNAPSLPNDDAAAAKTQSAQARINVKPTFPFMSVLVSGGHTLILHSVSLTQHETLASTTDIAIGECLDKIARAVLPAHVLEGSKDTMYGALLESFAFGVIRQRKQPQPVHDISLPLNGRYSTKPARSPMPASASRHSGSLAPSSSSSKGSAIGSTATEYYRHHKSQYPYEAPRNAEQARERNASTWGWTLSAPLTHAAGGLKAHSLEMSFSGLTTAVERITKLHMRRSIDGVSNGERPPADVKNDQRRDLAIDAMRVAFEHLASRLILSLERKPASTIVVAGGVASNAFLRQIIASTLIARGYGDVEVIFPPASLCCDNAAMIAWAGLEMHQSGFADGLDVRAIRKWPLDQLLSPAIEAASRLHAQDVTDQQTLSTRPTAAAA